MISDLKKKCCITVKSHIRVYVLRLCGVTHVVLRGCADAFQEIHKGAAVSERALKDVAVVQA